MSNTEKDGGARIRIGTRGSVLARWQTDHVKGLLVGRHPDLEIDIQVITTRGDRILDSTLPSIGGKGVFTAELETALLNGDIDIAVHSAKDVPTECAEGLVIGAFPGRGNPADVLVSHRGFTLETLPSGAEVGTGSPRRAAQLLYARPDLKIKDIRGNVDTRIRKALDSQGGYDAIVLAYAGLERLGRLDVVTQVLELDLMLPAPGQGALGVQCRDDGSSLALVRTINDIGSELTVTAERSFLTGLGGGCSIPVCALGERRNGELHLRGRVSAPDGLRQIDVDGTATVRDVGEAQRLGTDLATEALERGASVLLGTDR
ncbi:MAG: hydroxymethylbilane synthase [Candidatus Latescibacterota bacterium]|nr:MAG: hydroxymethylbilane synthase [Candidatus Latescibacterota bacterium]